MKLNQAVQVTVIIFIIFFNNLPRAAYALPLHLLTLPPQFKITLYARVPGARQMTLGEEGVVFVGSRNEGKVYALLPQPSSNIAKPVIVAQGLNSPNGVAYKANTLYVAEIDKILKFPNIKTFLTHKSRPEILVKLPKEEWHGWRYIKFGPDGNLYIAIGMPCNSCLKKEEIFGTIICLNIETKKFEIYAKGIRNSVGFDWNLVDKSLWFTDNGRDWLGDNEPPDELNWAPKKGMHFGFPFYNANKLDPSLGKYREPNKVYSFPKLLLGPHVAALGMIFYAGNSFPPQYHDQIFIAEHGSWNRTSKIGYQVTQVNLTTHPISYRTFITGWLQGEQSWGRPVDLLVLKDGSLLISDDAAGAIYRVSYQNKLKE